MSLNITIIPVTQLEQNCTIIADSETKTALIVDPGGDLEKIIDQIKQLDLKISNILLTHGHFDHISCAKELQDALSENPLILGPIKDDAYLFTHLPNYCANFSFPIKESFMPDKWLKDSEVIYLNHYKINVIATPGHTPGHVSYFIKSLNLALVGDVIFNNGIGRTDFPGGDQKQLMDSIFNQLLPLGDNVSFIPGHGAQSTFGWERKNNPYLIRHAKHVSHNN